MDRRLHEILILKGLTNTTYERMSKQINMYV